ncbi:tannase/feruloyl esterase family alpha/beta hydrolase [Agrobacterium sp. NPDC090283]|uniref:tannase/feruloyl esterase family alpha/beta hydrolase n=1 Tax=Agrobacterium sp. NPDC090283 TaxID=3363920 RepID=UPI00383A6AF0
MSACDDGDDFSGAIAGNVLTHVSSGPVLLTCDDSLKTAFKPNANTTVIAVKEFKRGDPLVLSGAPTANTPTAASDVCMVKLNVGPGNVGPADAPSTSPGIGIEVWLPSRASWNRRIHNLGGGGWQGGASGSPTEIDGGGASVAGVEGAVSSTTDLGHSGGMLGSGVFAMNPNGSLNEKLLHDFVLRGGHEQAVKTRALAIAYYGKAPKHTYFEGSSGGGRHGLGMAQNFPKDYDGIIAGAPAINWTRFLTNMVYPWIVIQNDLGGHPLTIEQLDLVSKAAISACDVVGMQHLGYVIDPPSCKYDPVKDPAVLCPSSGGANQTPDCVTTVQATAFDKFWYGMTIDGSLVSPDIDNGWGNVTTNALPTGTHRWWGYTRGTSLDAKFLAAFGANGVASPNGTYFIGPEMIALELLNPGYADPSFVNQSGNGQSLWKTLSYTQLAHAYDQGQALQPQFFGIDTNNPDLSAFIRRGGKMLTRQGLNDELVPPQGALNYYSRVAAKMGSIEAVRKFYRLFLIPGMGHGNWNGTSNPSTDIPMLASGQLYGLLTNWVENGVAPDQAVLASKVTPGKNRLICAYPTKPTYMSGDPYVANSWSCS